MPFRPALASVALSLGLVCHAAAETKPFQTFESCTFIATEWADGDSFTVRFPDGKERVIRLYHVDCMETRATQDSDKRRIREQGNYYGIEDLRLVVEAGEEASAFIAEKLSQPFTVVTSFADARGRSGLPRYYAYIIDSNGESLDKSLVSNGLARPTSVSRSTPDGISAADYRAELQDREIVAAIKGIGIWSDCNPDHLLKMRDMDREEARKLAEVAAVFETPLPEQPIDVNTASLEELESTGLRADLADQVIRMRPFESLDELIEVKGIGPKTLEKIRPHLKIGK